MNRSKRIFDILNRELKPEFIEVRDDSHKHAGHAGAGPGGETHYHLTIKSFKFSDLTKIQSHQLIYRLLDAELKSGLHALSIDIK